MFSPSPPKKGENVFFPFFFFSSPLQKFLQGGKTKSWISVGRSRIGSEFGVDTEEIVGIIVLKKGVRMELGKGKMVRSTLV